MKNLFSDMWRDWVVLPYGSFRQLFSTIRADRFILFAFIALLVIDLGWITWFATIRTLYNLEIRQDLYDLWWLRIDADGSYPEWFTYAKTLALVLLLKRIALDTRQLVYVALALLFATVLLDDFLEIHEQAGKAMADAFELPKLSDLRPRDLGELITWAIFGVVLVPVLVVGAIRSRTAHRANGLALMLPFAALLLCAILVDQVFHIWRDAFFCADVILATLEDGGEMIALTFACVLAAAMVKHRLTVCPETGHGEPPGAGGSP